MFRRPAAFALAGVALLLAVSVALPMAAADHAYSHRYVIFGRVVDAEGNPVPGIRTDLGFELFQPDGQCTQSTGSDITTEAFGPTLTNPVTNEYGDFVFCFHTHTMNRVEPGRGLILIPEMPEVEPVRFSFDPYFRQQFVLVQLPNASDNANPAAADSAYTVVGRIWQEASGRDVTVENIKVFGTTVDQEPVEIELLDPQGNVVANYTAQTNDYGDFAVRVPTETRFTEGTVRMTAAGRTTEAPATREGVTAMKLELEPAPTNALQNALWIGMWIAVAAAVVGGGYWGIRKISEKREIEAARANTTRKRANR